MLPQISFQIFKFVTRKITGCVVFFKKYTKGGRKCFRTHKAYVFLIRITIRVIYRPYERWNHTCYDLEVIDIFLFPLHFRADIDLRFGQFLPLKEDFLGKVYTHLRGTDRRTWLDRLGNYTTLTTFDWNHSTLCNGMIRALVPTYYIL